jgi:hypothetical protein
MEWHFCIYFQLSTLTALQRIHNEWIKVNSHLQYSCSPQHLSFKSFIPQTTLCGFAKPGTYLFNQMVSTEEFLCSYVSERPNLNMNWSDEPLANQESNFTTSSTKAVTGNNIIWIVYMFLTTSSLKFNKKKKKKITPEKIWVLPEICRPWK